MDWNAWEKWANETIPEPAEGVVLQSKKYGLDDIAKQCKKTWLLKRHELEKFATAFPPNLQGLKTLYDFCYHFFTYQPDEATNEKGEEIPMQALQSPAALWKYKKGDCKSYSVFIQSAIYHMGLPGVMYLVDYGHPTDKHIYPNAILSGQRVPLDVVYKIQQGGEFATEKKPYRMLNTIKHKGLYTVGNTAEVKAVKPEDLEIYAANLERQFQLPGGVDITTLTDGEFERWQLAQRLAAFEKHEANQNVREVLETGRKALLSGSVSGIGNLANTDFGVELARFIEATSKDVKPAFKNPEFRLPPIEGQNGVAGVAGFGSWVKKQTKKVGNAVKKVTGAVATAFKTVVNVFHKTNAKYASPFFLFAFLPAKALAKASPEVKRRHSNQVKMLDHMEKKGQLGSKNKILASMATGFKEEFGAMPQEVLKEAALLKKKKVANVGLIPLAVTAATTIASNPGIAKKAFGVLTGLVGAIVGIFKKKDKEDEDFEAMAKDSYSDLNLLASMEDTTEFEKGFDGYDSSGISPGSIKNPVSKGNPNSKGSDLDKDGKGTNPIVWIALAAAAALALKNA